MTVIAYARTGETYSTIADLAVHTCPSCGILYAAPAVFLDKRRDDNKGWYCPNGHSVVFRVTGAQEARNRADAAERRARMAEEAAKRQRERAERLERSRSALKGHLTRAKNRIANGVCPVPGCRRSGFTQVMRHIATKHPSWHAEHADDLK